jgi:4,5-DOPA dioxygenase extradiol
MKMMPSLFIAHGSPMLAIEENEYTKFLRELGENLPKPKAIVLFSAHWISKKQTVSEVERYSTIYDFYGFDPALTNIQYPAFGDKMISKEIEKLFSENGVSFDIETERGLDHGAWVVLHHLYPNVDVPVIAMSVNPNLTPMEQFNIGKTLRKLREDNVLIIASGGTVHNLRILNWRDNGHNDQWALEFENWLEDHLKTWDLESLYQYEKLAPNSELAVPPHGNEHFIPIFYAMGAADDHPKANLLHRSFRYGNLSHSVWQFG